MRLRQLWLHEFRNFADAHLELGDGVTAVVGANGQGKSNLLEAVSYLAALRSFRGAPDEAMVRTESQTAVVRAEGDREGRSVLVECEINLRGRNRAFINRQRLQRARDLLGALAVTVFSPDDLFLVRGGPSQRRQFLDDLMVSLSPKRDGLRLELDRILRQRNTLLRQAGGQTGNEDVTSTLDVWDAKLAEVGTAIAEHRRQMTAELEPLIAESYEDLAGSRAEVELGYAPSWGDGPLTEALVAARQNDLRRGVTSVGPHRDDLGMSLNAMPARTHASQGEQRTLALALRLGGHALVAGTLGTSPVLLLDDVFSELDPARSEALLAHMPAGQALLTTAGPLPEGTGAQTVLRVENGTILPG